LLAAWLILIYDIHTNRPAVEEENEEHLYPYTYTLDESDRQSAIVGLLTPTTAFILFVFVWQMPFLDSFGYHGEWRAAFLDVVTGAQVAFAPRLVVPLGLFSISLAGLEAFISSVSRDPGDEWEAI
jgi:hypothetical protein